MWWWFGCYVCVGLVGNVVCCLVWLVDFGGGGCGRLIILCFSLGCNVVYCCLCIC